MPWLIAFVLILAVLTMFAMSRTQPLQNVVTAFVVMTLLATPSLFIELALPAWAVPPLWAIIVLNSRGVSKVLLLPWRTSKSYGLWLIALGSILASVIVLPLKATFIWLPFAVLLQFATVPWLIEKRPVIPPPNFFPLWTWIALALASIGYARSLATQ